MHEKWENSSKYIFIKKRGEREDINEIKMRILVEHWYHRTTMYIRFQFFTYQVCGITFANRVMREIEREWKGTGVEVGKFTRRFFLDTFRILNFNFNFQLIRTLMFSR